MKKKLFCIALAMAMLLSACSSPEKQEPPTPQWDIKQEEAPSETPAPEPQREPLPELEINLDLGAEKPWNVNTIETNLVDNTVVSISWKYKDSNEELQTQIQYSAVSSGIVSYQFEADETIPTQFTTVLFSVTFNNPEHPQPEDVIAIYGDKGQYLNSKYDVVKMGDNNVVSRNWRVGFPDGNAAFGNAHSAWLGTWKNTVVSYKQSEALNNVWEITVGNSWHQLSDELKQQIIDDLAGTFIDFIEKDAGLFNREKTTKILFYDEDNKCIAEPKAMGGGYKLN